MKPLAIAFFLILAPLTASAQTVTLDSVSAPTACDTAQVTVYYTASGTFGAKNVFSVQFSEDSTFNTFSIAGQLKSTASGSITITASGTGWVRVASSTPTYLISNAMDFAILQSPYAHVTVSTSYALTGDNIVFNGAWGDTLPNQSIDSNITHSWNFGDGASPATSTDGVVNVSYATPGIKTVTLMEGNGMCSKAITTQVQIFSCDPSIPFDVEIDSANSFLPERPGSIWVVPGGTLSLSYAAGEDSMFGEDTVFAEPGANVLDRGAFDSAIIYLKAGAAYTTSSTGYRIIIYEPGASLGGASGSNVLQCNSLSYDYSNAPTYKITWVNGVSSDAQSSSNIRICPNPATNLVTIEAPEIPQSVVVRNDLGEIMLSDAGPIATSKLEFDVSHFAAGVYYVELTTGNGRSTSKFTISR